MTLVSRFSCLRHSRRRLAPNGARRSRLGAVHRRMSLEALEDRFVLSSVSFGTGSETVSASAGKFSIPVTLSSPPDGSPTVSAFASAFDDPVGLAIDGAGNVYVANLDDSKVSEVSPAGVVINTFSGFDGPLGMAFDAAGNLYVANLYNNTVSEVSSEGLVSTFASGLSGPTGLAFDAAGNLYVANAFGGGTVSEVSPAGVVSSTPFATGFDQPYALAFDTSGDLYVSDVGNNTVSDVSPAGAVSSFASGFSSPYGLAFDAAGNLYVANADNSNNSSGSTVSKVTPAGVVTTFASASEVNRPDALAFDTAGNLYVAADAGTTVVKISQTVSVPFALGGTAVSGTSFSGVTASPLTFGIGQTIQSISGTLPADPGPSQTLALTLGTPTGGANVGSPSANTLTITEPAVQFSTGSETINESAGTFSIPVTISDTPPTVSTFASGFSGPDGVAFDSAGNLYVANVSAGTISKLTPAGAVSTFASGILNPSALAFDGAGNLFVASDVGTGAVSEVTPAGVVSTFATGFSDPAALAFDDAGNLYVANYGNSTVSKVNAARDVTLFAAGFHQPEGLAFDAAGNLYVANTGNNTVSEVTPAGVVVNTFSGFDDPVGLAFDSAGSLYVTNRGNDTVSEVTPAGVVSSFASGLNGPYRVAFAAGNLYVANYGDNTVKKISETVTVPFSLGGTAVAGTAYNGITASPLTFVIGQNTQFITGTLLSDPGPNQTLIMTLGAPTGDNALGSTSVNTLTITEPATAGTPTPTPTSTGTTAPPVFLGETRVFSAKGKHKKLRGFEFIFNGALNADTAQSKGNYHVTQKQRGKKFKVLRVKSAVYVPGNFTIVISVGSFTSGKPALAVISGLAGADGAAISPITTGL